MNENADPIEEFYDRAHGKPGADHDAISEADAWATKQNPVRETPLAATGLKNAGK